MARLFAVAHAFALTVNTELSCVLSTGPGLGNCLLGPNILHSHFSHFIYNFLLKCSFNVSAFLMFPYVLFIQPLITFFGVLQCNDSESQTLFFLNICVKFSSVS